MQKLLVICGPTGTGKTDLAIKIAKKFNGEIVSADSRQVYTGMDIGTGKEVSKNFQVKKEKTRWIVNGIPIHLYDVINPDKRFSLADYQELSLEKIKDIHSRKKLPILVGGTGLYIQSVTEGLKIPKSAPDFKLRKRLEVKELAELLPELEKVDPKTFEIIDKKNPRRIVRALEVYYQSGKPLSELREKYKVDLDVLKIGLTSEREELYKRNDSRVESWFEKGFEKEVAGLITKYSLDLPALTSLGYRQVAMYIKGNLGMTEAKQRIKFDIHGYIRRQLTWFKKDKSISWYDLNMENLEEEINFIVKEFLEKEKNNIS